MVSGIPRHEACVASMKSGFFLSVSLRSDGLVPEPKGCFVHSEDKGPEEAAKIEANNVVIEANEKNRKVRVRGRPAMNATKHLWSGAIAAMVSRFVWDKI